MRERDGARVEGPDGPHRFGRPRWSRDGALLTLAAELHGDGLTRTLRLEALRLHDAAGERLVGLCGGADLELLDLRLAAPPRRRDAAGGEVLAPMHGRLLQLHVAIGDLVDARPNPGGARSDEDGARARRAARRPRARAARRSRARRSARRRSRSRNA